MATAQGPSLVESIADARTKFVRAAGAVTVVMSTVTALAAVAGYWVSAGLDVSAVVGALVTGLVTVGVTVPVGVVVSLRMRHLTGRAERLADARLEQVDEAGRRQEFASVVADALDMTDNETEVLGVIERAFSSVLPHRPVELLLADNSHAHLSRVVFTAPDGDPPGCEVFSPQDCPAAQRSQVQEFVDSDAINACPKLQGRAAGRCSALCIPVSVMGRTVGVVHTVGPAGASTEPAASTDLRLVATQAGTRLSMLRVMAETQLQATTDGLTGLLNRRALDNHYTKLLDTTSVTTVAMADLDHFKQLNDTYGHATGDRALRAFAQTLQTSLRVEDLISRRGGEEFSVVFPNCDAATATVALQRVQAQLQETLNLGGLPTFTASFGLVEANAGEDLETTLTRADIALFAAKDAGRNRIVVHDQYGVEVHRPLDARHHTALEREAATTTQAPVAPAMSPSLSSVGERSKHGAASPTAPGASAPIAPLRG